MAKMKIFEIAKSLDIKSTELVKLLNENGFEAKGYNSNIEDDAIAFLLKRYAPKKKEEAARKKEEKKIEGKEEPAVSVKEDKKPGVKESVKEEPVKKETLEIKQVQGKTKEIEEKDIKAAAPVQQPASVSPAQTPSVNGSLENIPENRSGNRSAVSSSNTNVQNTGGTRSSNSRDSAGGNRSHSNNQDAGGNRSNNGQNAGYRSNSNNQNAGGNRPYNNNNQNAGNRSNNNNQNGGNRPYNNSGQNAGNRSNNYSQNGGNRPYNNSGQNAGNRSNNNNQNAGGNRPYNNNGQNAGGSRTYNNQNGGNRTYNNNGQNAGGNRPYNNNNQNSGNRSNNNNQNAGGNRPYNNNNQNAGGNRSYNNTNRSGFDNRGGDGRRPGGGQNASGGQRYQNGGSSFAKQRADFDRPAFETAKPLEKTPQRKNDKNKKNVANDRNRKNRFRDNDINSLVNKKDPNRKGAFIKPQPVAAAKEDDGIKTVRIPEVLTIRDLSEKIKQPAAAIVKKLFLQGKMYSINQEISFEEAEEIALEYNCIVEKEEQVDVIEELLKEDEEEEAVMVKRPPVVCVMGHVDHGKTSLLDAIRETRVTEREAGGITQHIGAYMVDVGGEKITFLDTPGHEAFTSMRMRGAKSTDIAILVVAADDGVMPQTVEAINHAKAAEVEIIVAINKIDKPGANIERVKQELAEHELIAEDWGGSTVFVPVSAKTKEGLDQLLEMILLTSEVLELKANPNRLSRGIVIEAQLDKGKGPVATILVQKGTLHVGDSIVIGSAYGKVRAMMDDNGKRVKDAAPSTPVEILGLNEVPDAGEVFLTTENEKEARSISEAYIKQGREKLLADTKAKLSLDGLFSQIQAGNIKELNLVVKADVQGSVEAVKQSLLKLSNEEVAIRIIHGGVGAVNESDVNLAIASGAIIIAFNVRPDPTAKDIAEREKVDLRLYKVIYNAIEDIEAAMKGMLDPVFEEKIIGHAQIRQVFRASKVGNIAGSYVLDGKITRDCKVRILRAEELIYEGELSSLKRFKDDVKEVAAGYECGLVFDKFDAVQEEDTVEAYVMEEVPR